MPGRVDWPRKDSSASFSAAAPAAPRDARRSADAATTSPAPRTRTLRLLDPALTTMTFTTATTSSGAFLLVTAHVEIGVPVPLVRKPADQPGVSVVRENHRSFGSKKGIELGVRHPMRMLGSRLEPHQVDHIHHRTFNEGKCDRSSDTAAIVSRVGTSPQQASTTSGAPGKSFDAHSQMPARRCQPLPSSAPSAPRSRGQLWSRYGPWGENGMRAVVRVPSSQMRMIAARVRAMAGCSSAVGPGSERGSRSGPSRPGTQRHGRPARRSRQARLPAGHLRDRYVETLTAGLPDTAQYPRAVPQEGAAAC